MTLPAQDTGGNVRLADELRVIDLARTIYLVDHDALTGQETRREIGAGEALELWRDAAIPRDMRRLPGGPIVMVMPRVGGYQRLQFYGVP